MDLYLLEGRLNGMELPDADRRRLVEALKLISDEGSNFRLSWITDFHFLCMILEYFTQPYFF